jgi:hypothetical protein
MELKSQSRKDKSTIRFANRMFNTPRLGFLDMDTFDGAAHTHIGVAVNIFLRHQLLDQLLDSVNFPPNANRVDFPSISIGPSMNKTLQSVSHPFSRTRYDY